MARVRKILRRPSNGRNFYLVDACFFGKPGDTGDACTAGEGAGGTTNSTELPGMVDGN